MRRNRKSRGFTLLELVLALAMAGISLAAIVALLPVAESSSKAASDNTLVATMSASVIDDMRRQYFVDNSPRNAPTDLTPKHNLSDPNVLPGTSDVATGLTPAVVSPHPTIFFDNAGGRLKYSNGQDMDKTDALAAGALFQCDETLQGDVNTLSATGSDGSTAAQEVNLLTVVLTFTWPVQAANPPNSKIIYASIARY